MERVQDCKAFVGTVEFALSLQLPSGTLKNSRSHFPRKGDYLYVRLF